MKLACFQSKNNTNKSLEELNEFFLENILRQKDIKYSILAFHFLKNGGEVSNFDAPFLNFRKSKKYFLVFDIDETLFHFKISEEDFKLRGSGDLFGIRQSGDMNFKIADLKNDYNMLLKAKEDSEYFINNDLNKPKYKHIKDALGQAINLD